MLVKEVKDWLNTLDDYDGVGVDEGGLCLRSVLEPEVYCEIGGMPEDEEDETIAPYLKGIIER
jgi:hypothetical protein